MELNLSSYVMDSKPMNTYIPFARENEVYIEPNYQPPTHASDEPIYELYAVSNHYGSLSGGHYTAYAKNKERWFSFNDSSVSSVSESQVTSRSSGAYILFYRRKE